MDDQRIAILVSGSAADVRKLIKSGMDVDAFTSDGPTAVPPIVMAASAGNAGAIRALADAGANLEVVVRGANALKNAVRHGHVEAVKELLRAGFNPNLPDERWVGRNALWNLSHKQNALEIIDVLVRGGIDLDATDRAGRTCLWKYAGTSAAILKKLLDVGVDHSVLDKKGLTVLDTTLRQGYRKASGILREVGALTASDVRKRPKRKRSTTKATSPPPLADPARSTPATRRAPRSRRRTRQPSPPPSPPPSPSPPRPPSPPSHVSRIASELEGHPFFQPSMDLGAVEQHLRRRTHAFFVCAHADADSDSLALTLLQGGSLVQYPFVVDQHNLISLPPIGGTFASATDALVSLGLNVTPTDVTVPGLRAALAPLGTSDTVDDAAFTAFFDSTFRAWLCALLADPNKSNDAKLHEIRDKLPAE